MAIVAVDLPSCPSSVVPNTPDMLYGVPLADLLARCRSMAHKYYRKHGRWEPYEEYLSAGHMAITECIQRYNPALATSGGFLSYCCFQMEMKMRGVRYVAAGSYNMPKHQKGVKSEPKYAVESWDHEMLYALRSEPAKQESVTYLHEVLAYLTPQGKPSAMLLATAVEEPVEAVADQWGCTIHNVKRHTTKLRRRLRTWASWTAA